MPPEYEIVGQAPAGPLPGLDLSAAQVAGQVPVAAAPIAAVAPVAPARPAVAPRRVARKPELLSADPDGRQAVVRDVLGRTIVVKPLTVVMRMRLVGFLGKDLSSNDGYMHFAVIGCSVHSVDGEQLPMIADRNSLERVVAKIGDEGIAAAAVGLVALMPKEDEPSIEDEAKKLLESTEIRHVAALLDGGVPWSVAWECPPGEPSYLRPAEGLALRIAFGELKGGEWDWGDGGWKRGP